MSREDFIKVLNILKREFPRWDAPVVSLMAKRDKRTPYQILISTIISLRTKDQVTAEVSERLFRLADNPYDMLKIPEEKIAEAIYPAGFYRNKAKVIKEISGKIVKDFGGKVPDSIDELLKLKGVGRKTANLVVALGYGKPAICVDTHVHRISNRLGFVKTKTAEETEMALRKKVPREYWNEINDLFVAFGQTICKPVSPKCSECPVSSYCEKVGVKKHR
ncbi:MULTISPECIES: endonuclease III [Persephonella]|uniref:Endonuclease III n=1 Tax=Persephonella marina (strain DSM 14350 / EX-H1) TaxID=123214 RepID=C0QUN1_PERMH|nr:MULTISPECIES: endonuclease III [Persephonella]ACO04723.1 probable endonuclease III (DNA-(apurinic orapyrimidinic site) lyase) [Persephonella marina EX-H1]